MDSYCEVEMVRNLTGLTSGEIRDKRIRELRDQIAIPQVNSDLFVTVEKEAVKMYEDSLSNDLSDYDRLYRLQNIFKRDRKLGDLNNDGEISTDDVIVWYESDGNNSFVDVVEIDSDTGEFAVSEDTPVMDLYANYKHSPVSIDDPEPLLQVACAQLTGAYCFSNIETKKLKNYSIGDVTIRNQSDGFKIMHDQYKATRRRINNGHLVKSGENDEKIEDVILRNTAGGRIVGSGKSFFSGGVR